MNLTKTLKKQSYFTEQIKFSRDFEKNDIFYSEVTGLNKFLKNYLFLLSNDFNLTSNQKELVVKGLLIRNEYELRTYVRFTH